MNTKCSIKRLFECALKYEVLMKNENDNAIKSSSEFCFVVVLSRMNGSQESLLMTHSCLKLCTYNNWMQELLVLLLKVAADHVQAFHRAWHS